MTQNAVSFFHVIGATDVSGQHSSQQLLYPRAQGLRHKGPPTANFPPSSLVPGHLSWRPLKGTNVFVWGAGAVWGQS